MSTRSTQGIGFVEIEAGEDRLHAQVILLVDHDAEVLGTIDDGRAAGSLGSVFAADQVAFDQDLLLLLIELGQIRGETVSSCRGAPRHWVGSRERAVMRSSFLAQPGNGREARFRASRIRVLMTMSACGPSGSIQAAGWRMSVEKRIMVGDWVKRRGAVGRRVAELVDLVAQPHGVFEVLVVDRLGQCAAERIEPAADRRGSGSAGDFSGVAGPLVEIGQDSFDFGINTS